MPKLMGPVLSFRGCDDDRWNVTALVVTRGEEPGDLLADGVRVAPEPLWRHASGTAYRYTLAFPMATGGRAATYTVLGETYEVAIPAAGSAPTMAYTSCNGFSSLKLMKSVRDKHALWKAMADRHRESPYHLLVQGGDQVYADSMWETVRVMQEWNKKGWDEGNQARVPRRMPADLDRFYFDLYVSRWSQPEVAHMLARVPGIAMWDDHDLIDGWGSYPQERQECPVFGAIWDAGARAFAVFQQQLTDAERRPGAIGVAAPGWWRQPGAGGTRQGSFSCGYVVGGVAILALDMRSQRTGETQILSRAHWDEVFAWVDGLPDDLAHLIVMSSIPVVYPGFDTLESLLGFVPGQQELEDDLRDHWNSPPHKGERLRLVHRLLRVPPRGIKVTLLSGDVHVAALGVVQTAREQASGAEASIVQLISSGIVHPGPGGVVVFALQHLFDSTDEIDRGIVARMVDLPGGKAKFVGRRNYLSLEPDLDRAPPRLWCNWIVEDERFPFTEVVHPLPRPQAHRPPGRRRDAVL